MNLIETTIDIMQHFARKYLRGENIDGYWESVLPETLDIAANEIFLKPIPLDIVVIDMMSTHQSKLSIQAAAAHFNVSTKTIRRWIKARRLKAKRVNGQWYVQPDMDKMSKASR